MMKKILVAVVLAVVILAALFLINGYPKSDDTGKPADDSNESIEADLQQTVQTGESDFLKLDTDIQKL